jgi:hypothetical protein
MEEPEATKRKTTAYAKEIAYGVESFVKPG